MGLDKELYDEKTGARFRYQGIREGGTDYAAKTMRNHSYGSDAWMTYTVAADDLLEVEDDNFWKILTGRR